MTDSRLIHTVAAVISDEKGRVLLVRKHGSDTFIQPGGKREEGEESLATLARELEEELGVSFDPVTARRLGKFEENAVHEPDCRVHAEVYWVEIDGTPEPGAEIEEMRWLHPRAPFPVNVAPLSARWILPSLRSS